MRRRRQGSALLLVLIIGSVLLLGLAALIGVALNEYRNAERSALSAAAFFLAEAGVDRSTPNILDDSFATDAKWASRDSATFTRTFTADSQSLGNHTGGYSVVVRKNQTLYTVSAQGWVANPGANLTTTRAVEVVFERTLANSGFGNASGCIAVSTFTASSTGASSISATQPSPTFDSYSSANNTAPGTGNRNNKVLVGTLGTANDALNLGNGQYFATVSTGSSASVPTPTVATAKNASPPYDILAKIDDPNDKIANPVTFSAALVRHDLDFAVDPGVPPAVESTAGWYLVLPRGGKANTQWRLNGKLSDFSPSVSSTTTHVTSSGGTIAIGTSDADKHYIATASLDNVSALEISGEVILVCLGPINATNGLKVNYRTAGAKLTIYAASSVSGVIRTTQQIGTAPTATPNHEAARLAIGLLPGNHNITVASLEPAAINASVSTAVKNPTAGGTIIMNFGDQDTFVGQIHAPYSAAQLSAVGQKGKLSDYCGSLLAKTVQITGSNGFAFHYDEALGQGSLGGKNPVLTRKSWRQLGAGDTVFR